MTRPVQPRGDYVAAIARHLASAVAGLLIVAMIARTLGSERLAAWTMVGTTSYLIGISDLGMSTVVQRSAARDRERTVRALGSAFTVITCVAPPLALASGVGLRALLRARLPQHLWLEADRCLIVALVGGMVGSYGYPVRAWLLATDGVRGVAGARLVGALVQLMVACGGLALAQSLVAPALAVAVTHAVELALLTTRLRRRVSEAKLRRFAPQDAIEARSFAHEALAAITIQASIAAASRADVLIVAAAVPLDAVAAYGVVTRAVEQALVLAKQIGTALIARLADASSRERAVRVGAAALGVLSASGLTALGILGQPLLVAWTGAVARHETVPHVLALSVVGAMVVGVTEVPSLALLIAAETPWAAARPIAAGSVANIVATALLVQSRGAVGASLAATIGHLVTGLLVVRGLRELLGWSARDFAYAAAPALFASVAAGAVGFALARYPEQTLVRALAATALACSAGTGGGLAVWLTLERRLRYRSARATSTSSDSSTST